MPRRLRRLRFTSQKTSLNHPPSPEQGEYQGDALSKYHLGLTSNNAGDWLYRNVAPAKREQLTMRFRTATDWPKAVLDIVV